ncbi:DNA-processing protein DprA [Vibrio rhizosphaerae]|uniref:DNA-processing protein DprA n=1 Tax=Vibrio rhizosphaerae TaxID=398736 RepID=A0ABU4IPX8_9VIBR|nr:DNA-processing protein DprA [Vibrio rhizosphaerae]MDW6091455.1 DNA-processing protein DprA [Vibrio rhizosphaerae]
MDPSASHTTEHDRLLIWIKLCLTPRLGIQSLLKLVSKVPLDSLSDYSEQEWFALGLTPTQITYLLSSAAKQVAEDCLEWQERGNHRHILTYFSPDYPALLKEIPSPPPLLFAQGDITLLSVPQMAIVGSRHASMQGLQDAWHFANEFAQHQVAVTSGLALGIDGQAHLGALDGGGKTIAVLGAGLARIYPARHRGLAERMLEQQSGVLVSEFCPSTPPKSQNFPRRNRIISGLSLGVLVIEAAEKSGSLITARYAVEQNRDVFVIPGAIHQHGYRGSNALIRDGACLVQNIEQILSEVGTLSAWVKEEEKQADKIQQNELFPPLIDDEELPFAELLANVGVKATPVDILAARTHIPVHEVMRQLLELELSGHVIAVAGGYIRKGRG